VLARDAENITLVGPPQRQLDLAHAVDAVGRDPGKRHARRDRPRDHAERQVWFGREGDARWHVRGCHSRRIAGPGFWQIELAVDEGVALVRDIGGKHPDLAVGDLARRAGVLPPHAAGGVALLQEAGLVDHQHGLRCAERLDHVVAHHIAQSICVPVAAPQDGLLPPGAGITSGLGSHPAGLAPLGPEQSVQEGVGGSGDAWRSEQGPNPMLGLTQRRRPELQSGFERGSGHQPSYPKRIR
jgi:hypothetical protein